MAGPWPFPCPSRLKPLRWKCVVWLSWGRRLCSDFGGSGGGSSGARHPLGQGQGEENSLRLGRTGKETLGDCREAAGSGQEASGGQEGRATGPASVQCPRSKRAQCRTAADIWSSLTSPRLLRARHYYAVSLSSCPRECYPARRLSSSSALGCSLIDHHRRHRHQVLLLFLSLCLHASFFLPHQWEHTHRREGDSPGPHTEPPDPCQARREGAHQCESGTGGAHGGAVHSARGRPEGCGLSEGSGRLTPDTNDPSCVTPRTLGWRDGGADMRPFLHSGVQACRSNLFGVSGASYS